MENIAVITYPFISGLYYLSDSFKFHQESIGNKVYLIPKRNFVYKDGRWRPKINSKISGFLDIREDISYEIQILNYLKKFNIKKIFSFETFLRDSAWIKAVISYGAEIIDIPMPEWSQRQDLESGRYKVFSEVYCLTDQSYFLFKKHSNAVSKSWDYCPRLDKVEKEKNKILTLYHPGSNAEINQKNTKLLLNDFYKVSHKNIRLIISGFIDQPIKDGRVNYIGKNISRQEIYNAYKSSDCIISPSSREGLGMCFYEAKKFSCDIITTDSDPMREHSKYLCKVSEYNKTDSLVPISVIKPGSILEQINRYYEDFYGKK